MAAWLAIVRLRVYTRDMKPELDCACDTLRRLARQMSAIYDKELRPTRLRITQFSVLAEIYRNGAQPTGVLADALGLESSTMRRNLKVLKAKGLVELVKGEDDGRECVGYLTPDGEAVVQAALPRWRRAQTKVRAIVNVPHLARLLRELSAH